MEDGPRIKWTAINTEYPMAVDDDVMEGMCDRTKREKQEILLSQNYFRQLEIFRQPHARWRSSKGQNYPSAKWYSICEYVHSIWATQRNVTAQLPIRCNWGSTPTTFGFSLEHWMRVIDKYWPDISKKRSQRISWPSGLRKTGRQTI